MREEQQTTLLSILRSAGGAPVSYAHLREHGIEFPANVAAELELQGIALEHCDLRDAPRGADGSRRRGLKLSPGLEEDLEDAMPADPLIHTTHALSSANDRAEDGREAPRMRRAHIRWPALLALLAAIAAAAAIVAVNLAPTNPASHGAPPSPGAAHRQAAATGRALGSRGQHASAQRRPTSASGLAGTAGASAAGPGQARKARHLHGGAGAGPPTAQSTRGSRSPATASGRSTRAKLSGRLEHLPAVPVSGTLATQLEAEGHGLLEAGRASNAVPVLTRAVAATGERPGQCLQPSGETCLTYAYALYDLGHALQLAGHPGAAVPILRERLRIDNQRPVVRAELQLALSQEHHRG